MKLIIGQGNPSPEYHNTRHNVGFSMLEALAAQHDAPWQPKTKFKADIAEIVIDGQKTLLAKPATYYNLTGESAQAICNFYKINLADVLVIHDELALPFGVVRTRIGGSDAGNNGIKSLISHLGVNFARIRIGIGDDRLAIVGAHDFVLSRFTQEQAAQLPNILEIVTSFIDDFINDERTFRHHSMSIQN